MAVGGILELLVLEKELGVFSCLNLTSEECWGFCLDKLLKVMGCL